jgi:hypothetical protein
VLQASDTVAATADLARVTCPKCRYRSVRKRHSAFSFSLISSVSVCCDTADGTATADLDEVVEAAVFAPRHRVAWKAHTGDAMRATLEDNAKWIRRLLTLLRESGATDMIRRAAVQEKDGKGNPKKRPRNVKWKFGQ